MSGHTCRRCGEPAIAGDGADICMGCVLELGALAGHPGLLTQGQALRLLAIHGDVVRLAIERDQIVWRTRGVLS
jgi:hypothetical protein